MKTAEEIVASVMFPTLTPKELEARQRWGNPERRRRAIESVYQQTLRVMRWEKLDGKDR